MGGEATEHDTINKAGAAQLIPKEKKRALTDDQRADFEKAMQRYASAKKSGGLSGSECSNVSDAFKSVADSNPGLSEARFNQGAVLAECGREEDAERVWRGMSNSGPALTNLGYAAWKRGERGEAESDFNKAIQVDPLHTVEALNNLAQILRDKARHASSPDEKKQYVSQAVSKLRTALALDSNNLEAFSTLAFIYYDMNMLEMAKLVGNQAVAKADEIATGKFAEEKVEEAADGKAGKAKGGKKEKKEGGGDDTEGGKLAKEVNVHEEGTGVTADMKRNLATVYNTLGLVELKKKNISPAIGQFKKAVEMNPKLAEAHASTWRCSRSTTATTTPPRRTSARSSRCSRKTTRPRSASASRCAGTRRSTRRRRSTPAAEKLDPVEPLELLQPGPALPGVQGRPEAGAAQGPGLLPRLPRHANDKTPESFRKDAEKRSRTSTKSTSPSTRPRRCRPRPRRCRRRPKSSRSRWKSR